MDGKRHLGNCEILDIEAFRYEQEHAEIDRVSLAPEGQFSNGLTRIPLRVNKTPFSIQSRKICCLDAIPIHRVPPPCCIMGALFNHDRDYWDPNRTAIEDDWEDAHFRRGSVLTRILSRGHTAEEYASLSRIFESGAGTVILLYLPRKTALLLLSPLGDCECNTHNRLGLDSAFSAVVEDTRFDLAVKYRRPIQRNAVLSIDLNNFILNHVEDIKACVKASLMVEKAVQECLNTVCCTANDIREGSNGGKSPLTGPYPSMLYRSRIELQHEKRHADYFKSWVFIVTLCECPERIAQDALRVLRDSGKMPHIYNIPGIGSRIRKNRVIYIASLYIGPYFEARDVQNPWKWTSRFASGATAFQLLHTKFPHFHLIDDKYGCKGCEGNWFAWMKMKLWVDRNRLSADMAALLMTASPRGTARVPNQGLVSDDKEENAKPEERNPMDDYKEPQLDSAGCFELERVPREESHPEVKKEGTFPLDDFVQNTKWTQTGDAHCIFAPKMFRGHIRPERAMHWERDAPAYVDPNTMLMKIGMQASGWVPTCHNKENIPTFIESNGLVRTLFERVQADRSSQEINLVSDEEMPDEKEEGEVEDPDEILSQSPTIDPLDLSWNQEAEREEREELMKQRHNERDEVWE